MTTDATAAPGAPANPAATPAAPGAPAAPNAAPAPAAAAPAPLALGDAAAAPAASLPAAEAAPAPAAPTVTPVTYDSTGDPGLDLALDFVGQRGFGPDHPAMVAAINGDFGPLKAELAKNPDAKGFERYVALAEAAHQREAEKATAKQAADREAIHKVVGGEEAWNAIQAWATEQTADSPEQRAEVNAALSAGGMQAKAMAAYLANLHAKAAGTVVEPASRVQAPGAVPAAGDAGPVSAMEFATKSRELRAKLGPEFEGTAEFKALVHRRAATMARGQ